MYKHIVVPVDLNEESSWRKAVPTAIQLCRTFGAELHLLSVVPDYGMTMVSQYFPEDFEKKAIDGATRDLHALSEKFDTKDITVQHVIAHGTIYEEVINTADGVGADLIVMASHRPQLSDYLLGPNAARVVRHAKQSVLVVRE
jgi:nucleotide-binding universal stress UspA family protein